MKLIPPKKGYVKFKSKDNVIIGEYKKGIVIDLDSAKAIVKERRAQYSGDRPYVIVDKGVKGITKEAMKYFSTPESFDGITAIGMVQKGRFSRLMMKFLVMIASPPVRVKIFEDENKAVAWAKRFSE